MNWDPVAGTAGGAEFGSALKTYAAERELSEERLAEACGVTPSQLQEVFTGTRRLAIPALARATLALRTKPIEFMQHTGLLSLELYAFGLDPLYFLPEGQVRYDARIYMREINPRHRVPEADMTRRNPTLKGIAEDPILDAEGKVELELAYLLRAASQQVRPTS